MGIARERMAAWRQPGSNVAGRCEVEPDERRLLDSARTGDIEAFAQLYARFRSPLFAVCLRILKDRPLAEDVVQDTFVRGYTKLQQFEMGKPAWPWLVKIAENRCVDLLRQHQRVTLVEDMTVAGPPGRRIRSESRDVTTQAVIESEERATLRAALAELPERQRRALLLYALEGWSYEDIAAAEGVSLVALKSLIFRARFALRGACQRGVHVLVLVPLKLVRDLRVRLRVGPSAPLANGAATALASSQLAAALLAVAMTIVGSVPGSRVGGPMDREIASPTRASGRAERAEVDPGNLGRSDHPDSGPAGMGSLIGDLTDPNRDVRDPEDARITSVVFSPRFEQDGTILASGYRSRACPTRCPSVLFRSTDFGATWKRLAAEGLEGTGKLLLPPAFGRGDGRIFAMGALGLQVSQDGGRSFQPVTLSAGFVLGSAAISPLFNEGVPEIIVGAGTLTIYNADLGSFVPAPYTAIPGPLEPAYSPDYRNDGVLLVGGVRNDVEFGLSSTVFRCDSAVCSEAVIQRPGSRPKLRVAPDFAASRWAVAFTNVALFSTRDGGRTFAPVAIPWQSGLLDVAFLGRRDVLFAAVATSDDDREESGLYRSTDAGRSWVRLHDRLLDDHVLGVSTSGKHVVALLRRGVACSSDGGTSWHRRCR